MAVLTFLQKLTQEVAARFDSHGYTVWDQSAMDIRVLFGNNITLSLRMVVNLNPDKFVGTALRAMPPSLMYHRIFGTADLIDENGIEHLHSQLYADIDEFVKQQIALFSQRKVSA